MCYMGVGGRLKETLSLPLPSLLSTEPPGWAFSASLNEPPSFHFTLGIPSSPGPLSSSFLSLPEVLQPLPLSPRPGCGWVVGVGVGWGPGWIIYNVYFFMSS